LKRKNNSTPTIENKSEVPLFCQRQGDCNGQDIYFSFLGAVPNIKFRLGEGRGINEE